MLFRKMLRDFKLHKTQFISIFLMTFLGLFVYAGISAEWMGMQYTTDTFYEDTNIADVWLIGNGFSQDDLETVKSHSDIKEAQRRLTIDSTGSFSNNPIITLNFIEENSISTPHIVKGEKFTSDKDGIWINDSFAKMKNLNVGDDITVSYNGLNITKTIKGTIYSSEYIYSINDTDLMPNYNNYGYAYLSENAFPEGSEIIYNEILFTTDKKNSKELEDSIYKALNGNYSVYLPQKNLESNMLIRNEISQHRAFGLVFPIVFLAIALLTILTTMTRIVSNQRTQIGILKSIGFKKRKILYHYVSYGLWLSLSGAILGVIVGPLTLPHLFFPAMSKYFILPEYKAIISPIFGIVALSCVLVCTFVTYVACKKILNETPSQTLRPKTPKAIRHSKLQETTFWKKLGFNIQWNLRDIFRSKIRSLMAVFGIISCTALLVSAFGFYDSLEDVRIWQYEELNTFESQINLDETATSEQISHIIDSVNGEAVMYSPIEIKYKDTKKSSLVTINDNVSLIKTTDINRDYIELPSDEVSISLNMAKSLGVKIGDEVSWHLYGDSKWITSEIVELYRTPTSQGITVSKDYFENNGYTFRPTKIVTAENVIENFEGVSSVWSADDLTAGWDEMTQAMSVMTYCLIVAAVLLAIVVLYNLGLLSFTEMERELATLKVIGFKSRKIRHLLLYQNLLLSIIGLALGIPGGKLLIDFMISTIADGFDMMTIISIKNAIVSSLFTLSLSVGVNLMFSNKIKCIDMVSSLKGTE